MVLQNMRPGLVARLGLDGASLREQRPDLVYCNMFAFGARGPMKDRPGYDPLMQFLHEVDALSALKLAVLREAPGVFNIVGDGVL